MDLDVLAGENDRLRQENARLLSALEEIRLRLVEPEEVIRAIRQGEVDALVIEESGQEELYSLQTFDSVYRAVVEECFPYGVWLAETDGRLRYVTPSFLKILGTDLQEMQAKGQFHFLTSVEREGVELAWARCRETGDAFSVEYTVRLAGGSERTIWTHAILARTHEGTSRWVGVNVDVTERERVKRELHEQTEALREADRRKDEFLAMLAHELRNPLAPLRNGVQILRLAGGEGRSVVSAAEMMERQVAQMTRLIDDLLDVSRICQRKVSLRRKRIELAEVVAQAVEASRPAIDARSHRLSVAVPAHPVHVHADSARLEQVLTNLLNNASKFTDRGGSIWLIAEVDGDQAVVRVRDSGIGIPADKLDGVFDLFAQVDPSMERSQGGLGIGLTLVKRLVEMHGGTVEATSDGPGRGSEFVIRLPIVAAGERNGAADQPQSSESFRRVRILVVDDNRDAANSLAELLGMLGHDARTAHDGPSALAAAETFRPEVVVCDLGMPDINGYEVARRLRRQFGPAEVVLVAVTGYGADEDRRRSREAGFDHHFTKPVDPTQLTRLLANLYRPEGTQS